MQKVLNTLGCYDSVDLEVRLAAKASTKSSSELVNPSLYVRFQGSDSG